MTGVMSARPSRSRAVAAPVSSWEPGREQVATRREPTDTPTEGPLPSSLAMLEAGPRPCCSPSQVRSSLRHSPQDTVQQRLQVHGQRRVLSASRVAAAGRVTGLAPCPRMLPWGAGLELCSRGLGWTSLSRSWCILTST